LTWTARNEKEHRLPEHARKSSETQFEAIEREIR